VVLLRKTTASVACLLLLFVVIWSGCGRDRSRLNVIWITFDALRADHLGCYGYPLPTSLFIDSLAARGVRLDMAISQAPATKASVASMFTSLHPSIHKARAHGARGRVGDVLPAGAATLAERFTAAGFLTAGFVANPHLQRNFGFDHGFEVCRYLSVGPVAKADKVLGNTLEWLRGEPRVREENFFVYIHLMDTHFPYEPPRPHRGMFVNPALEGCQVVYTNGLPEIPPTDDEMRYLRGLYDGALHFADDQLRIFVEGLERQGLLKNTLVIVVADHGDEFLDHGGLGHGSSLYSELIRVPAIFFCPERFPAGRVIRSPVSIVDLGVSLLSLSGIEWDPRTVTGRDISGLLSGARDDPEDLSEALPVLSERSIQRAVISDGHKYIFRGNKPGNGEKLFDLAGDHREVKNLMWTELEKRKKMVQDADELLTRILALDQRLGLQRSTAPMGQPTRDQLRELGYIE